jgi:Uncharacterized protein conserved in bacteria (DUF2188)
MAKDVLHVVPNDEGWGVKREGNERFSSTHGTQKEAIDSARNLAHEGDDIVVHRPDGTIRERTTYTAAANGAAARTNGDAPRTDGEDRTRVRPWDVFSVGSRVSWPAVLAGLAVAVATYVCLMTLALAVGASTVDHVQNRSFATGAAIVSIVTLLAALFLGGFVTSRLSTGETMGESVVYGVLLWSALFFTVLLTGLNAGNTFGLVAQAAQQQPAPAVAAAPGQDAAAANVQRVREQTLARGDQWVADMDPAKLAWWSFAGMALSLLAAIGGSVVGAGPELVFRQFVRDEPAGRVAVQPAT